MAKNICVIFIIMLLILTTVNIGLINLKAEETDTYPPEITSVENNPDTVGFGFNITIAPNVTDNMSGVNLVKVNITYPDNSTGNFTMNNTGNDTYEYEFDDAWLAGQYNYTIWTVDNANNTNISSQYSFNVSTEAAVTVCTIKDAYSDNEFINLTDPPGGGGGSSQQSIGYELLNDNEVLHIWNKFDSYYFNTSSGIQLTNHYDEYWSHNVLMLGYYNNDKWNLIYRTDELSGFNKDIDTDNETYVNATLWKDLNYQGYDFRLAIRYHLSVDDNELTVIPYIKNIDQDDIPYVLGFAWEINDIQVDMTYEDDYIEINGSLFYLNDQINVTFKNMAIPVYCWNETTNESYVCGYEPIPYFNIRDDQPGNRSESLYLKWDESLNYVVQVKSREGEYNSPVTLAFKIGTLDAGQEKSTELLWHDASEVTYYFDRYDRKETWATNPGNMVDGSTSNYASTTSPADVELCNGNTCEGSDLGTILKVELRTHGYYSIDPHDIILRPVFDGENDGEDYAFDPYDEPSWSQWFDITNDNNAPEEWNWSDIRYLDCDVEAENDIMEFTLYCSKVEVRVTYTIIPLVNTTYYFSGYNVGEAWSSNPGYMVDGNLGNYASTGTNGDIELCNLNTCEGEDLGEIYKVALRAYGYYSEGQCNITLRPVFNVGSDGDNHTFTLNSDPPSWSQWFDITEDTNAPSEWDWDDIVKLDCDVEVDAGSGDPEFVSYCSKVEVRVTYIPLVYAPTISNPYPANGASGVSITPTLNITINDADGNTMNVTWYSNSSGSWQVFGTNNSVGNGTYHQMLLNATVNGQWWYWKVNVSDLYNYTESSVYKFYTGYESKIENTGSTNFSGYLKIQIRYYSECFNITAVDNTIIEETTPRTINATEQLALDTIMNGLVNSSNLTYGNGTYHIFVSFTDPDGNVLVCNNNTPLSRKCSFNLSAKTQWERLIVNGFGNPYNTCTRGIEVYNDELYVGTQNTNYTKKLLFIQELFLDLMDEQFASMQQYNSFLTTFFESQG
ncbi:MAG: hypothetical protein JSW06_04255 [Thermoplasmatales archaeon]|nr:MAG: hypothetical protein JSW06_04255 [Thermoplasmatales archaeon]